MLKRLIFIILLFIFTTKPSAAHIAGQPPFFLMNDKFADFYPVYTTSLSDFSIPQDIAPDHYLINEPIEMKIDKTFLPFPPEVIQSIKFDWDFGDGTKAAGEENSHTYTKPGSYLLTIQADYGDYSGPNAQPVIQAVLIHVLPDKDYKLPQAKITLNNRTIGDPLADTVVLQSQKNITLDASHSITGSAPITEYFWDLGNGKKSTSKKNVYTLPNDKTYFFPFLRVKDANGFISDTYVQIENGGDQASTTNSSTITKYGIPLLIVTNILLLGGAGWYIFKKKSS